MYNEKDLTTENQNSRYYGEKSEFSRISTSKTKLTLQSAKSEKRLLNVKEETISSNSRIIIGHHEKLANRGEEESNNVIHNLNYGGGEKKTEGGNKNAEKVPEYGRVRKF